MTTTPSGKKASAGYAAVRAHALRFPEAYEEFPWGHSAIKVRKKIFVILGEDGSFSMSLKLGESNFEALLLPFTEPTHYGMGKHGWVTARFARGAKPPLGLLCAWIEESYRAIAPKTLVKRLDAEGLPADGGTRKAAAKASGARKATTRRAAARKTSARKGSTRKASTRSRRR